MIKAKHLVVVGLALAAIPLAAAASGDAQRGKVIYERCMGCHAIGYEVVGPDHAGLYGRKAGSLPDYDYSPGMRKAGWIWDEEHLDRFLTNPRAAVPGTKMGFAGIPDAGERQDLIAYLKVATRK